MHGRRHVEQHFDGVFAREQLNEGKSAREAALEAGFVRMRPVVMTALAMIIGMVPMAIGLGEGGEQNAPLGRAVIGGLLFATFATLFFVPCRFLDDSRTPRTQTRAESGIGSFAGNGVVFRRPRRFWPFGQDASQRDDRGAKYAEGLYSKSDTSAR